VSQTPGDPDLSAAGWQKRYDANQTGWDRGEPNPALLQWLKLGALKAGSVYVPGCGLGHEVVELAKRGFEVTAVDFTQSATQSLKQRLLNQGLVAEVLRESVLHYRDAAAFDAVYEQTCLCAIDPKQWTNYEQRLHASLRIGGKLFALFMQTDSPIGPPFHCDLDAMQELFHDCRWRWSDGRFTVDHPSGMKEIAVVLTKKES